MEKFRRPAAKKNFRVARIFFVHSHLRPAGCAPWKGDIPMDTDTDDEGDGPPLVFRRKQLRAWRRRSQIYSWLRAHRREIAAGLASMELTWPRVCQECARQGVAKRNGREPTRDVVARTWQVLLRDLAAIGETPLHKPERPKPPSRLPDWTPPAFQQPVQAPPDPSPVPAAPGPAADDDGAPYDPIQRNREIREMMDRRSGRKP
jgi:hypothetical protein